MLRALREALLGFTRARVMTAFAVISTAFSLLVLDCLGIVLINLSALIRVMEDKVEIVVYLRDDADRAKIGLAVEDLSRAEGVARVEYVSKDEALERFRQDLGEDSELLQDLEGNPVPASLSISMQPGRRDTLSVRQVADLAAAYPFVEEVDYGREWLQRMEVIHDVASTVGMVGFALLSLVAVVLIASAIKIAIFSRQKEIIIMKIVGATNGYIRRSFLLEGFLKGALGGLVASGLVVLIIELFNRKVYHLAPFPAEYHFYTIAAGALMGLLGSWISLSRYLRRI